MQKTMLFYLFILTDVCAITKFFCIQFENGTNILYSHSIDKLTLSAQFETAVTYLIVVGLPACNSSQYINASIDHRIKIDKDLFVIISTNK